MKTSKATPGFVVQSNTKPDLKFVFDKKEYSVKITFKEGLSFTTTVPRVAIINKGQTKEGLFKHLVDVGDAMQLPTPRIYRIEGLRKIYKKK